MRSVKRMGAEVVLVGENFDETKAYALERRHAFCFNAPHKFEFERTTYARHTMYARRAHDTRYAQGHMHGT